MKFFMEDKVMFLLHGQLNTMDSDGLVMQGSRESANIVFTRFPCAPFD